MKIGIIGGGASGFFAAISAASHHKNAEIIVFEKSNKLLSKVKVSGGGRCNVTNATFENSRLSKNYPRGSKELKKAFEQFSVKDTVEWFESRGVKLKTEEDNRIFPVTDDSQSIIDCLLSEANRLKIKINLGYNVLQIIPPNESQSSFTLQFADKPAMHLDRVIIAKGGSPGMDGYKLMENSQHPVLSPVPSLFTFNIPNSKYKDLQGISLPNSRVKIAGIKNEQNGPLLITHWGLSGPAVLKMSAWEARKLHELNYQFNVMVNFTGDQNEESVMESLRNYKSQHPKQLIYSNPLFAIPKRLWERLCEIAGIGPTLRWLDIPNKNLNKLMEELIRGNSVITGKTTFKEEFVTCGGIDLKSVNIDTMESKLHKGLFFAGEVLDIDGITGGFNFQAAWTTGYIAGKNVGNS